jgi:hypothetical protein
MFRAIVFPRWQLHCPTAATMSSQLLLQQGGAIQFWVLPSVLVHQLRDPPPAPFWDVGLLPHPYFQTLCLASPLLGASSALLGSWLVTPSLLSAFVTFPTFVHWEFGSLSHPCSLGQIQLSTQLPLLVLNCNSLFMLFSFVGGNSICLGAVLDYRGWEICVPLALAPGGHKTTDI